MRCFLRDTLLDEKILPYADIGFDSIKGAAGLANTKKNFLTRNHALSHCPDK